MHQARIHHEEGEAESTLFRSYFAPGHLRVLHDSEASRGGAANADTKGHATPRSDLSFRRHERCCLWPRLPTQGKLVLYHVNGAATPPARIDASRSAVSAKLLDEARGSFVLEVTAPDVPPTGKTPAASSGSFGCGGIGDRLRSSTLSHRVSDADAAAAASPVNLAAGRRGEVTSFVWGGVHLLQRPAAAERMTAVRRARHLLSSYCAIHTIAFLYLTSRHELVLLSPLAIGALSPRDL
jgi:hypothetical protein